MYNRDEVSFSKLKEHIVKTNRERVEKRIPTLEIKTSEVEVLNIQGGEYNYFSSTYILGPDFTQKSKYAYKELDNFILLVEFPLTSRSGDKSPDKNELIKFLHQISYLK